MIAALKRTRIYQRFRAQRERSRQRSRKALARSVERGLRNDDAVLRALTHLVERAQRDESVRERRDEELRWRLERLERLIAELRGTPGRGDGADERPRPGDQTKEG